MPEACNTKRSRIAWHPGMVSALKLELYANKDDLEYQEEYLLNKEPVRVDLLVLKKRPGAVLQSSLARHFRRYNIFELKSPDDQLNIDTICNTLSYAYKYKAMGESVDSIPIEEISITMVRRRKPQKLFQYVLQHNGSLQETEKGIWRLECHWGFPVYVIVLNQVDADTHLWLSVLGKDLTEQSVMQILSACKSYVELDKKRLVDSTMSVLMQSNRNLFVELKGADAMCKEFFEIFEPEINALIDERTKDIRAAVTEQVTKSVTKSVTKRVTKSVTFSRTLQMIQTAMQKNKKSAKEVMDFLGMAEAEQKEYLAVLQG